ncbi:MAG: transcriptional regulator, MarR family-like protein [Ramlibacter sp.]|nr:transcriptional regulator, MarR family-like protein [Ramlibacter sp.]
MPRPPSPPSRSTSAPAVETVDTSFLETLLGYNARRAALAVIDVFLERMAPYQLKPVDFSVLSVVAHNPGITSRQLCTTLGILPPNLVGMVNALEKRELILREPHPRDGRAMGLHLTGAGQKMMRDAEQTAAALEADVASRLSPTELRTLISLLKKVYRPA